VEVRKVTALLDDHHASLTEHMVKWDCMIMRPALKRFSEPADALKRMH